MSLFSTNGMKHQICSSSATALQNTLSSKTYLPSAIPTSSVRRAACLQMARADQVG
jgi:hypothetical protein